MRERTAADDIVQGAANRALLDLILPAMRTVAKKQGWSITTHGSMNRDIDVVAVPWTDHCQKFDHLLTSICGAVAGVTGNCLQHNDWQQKPHGRVAKTLLVFCGETHMTIDFSAMPVQAKPPAEV